jgi:hypothetical protein
VECYNAAMSKPFQFSMRRMFAAATLFCIAAMLWTLYVKMHKSNLSRWHECLVALLYLGSFSIAGAGVGTITRTPFYGAASGAMLAIVGVGLVMIFG